MHGRSDLKGPVESEHKKSCPHHLKLRLQIPSIVIQQWSEDKPDGIEEVVCALTSLDLAHALKEYIFE